MKKSLLCVALALVPIAAQASDISYNYVELDYLYQNAPQLDSGAPGSDSQGFGLKGSLAVNENWFLTTEYSRQKLDNWDGHNSVDSWSLGGGYLVRMGGYDWVTQATYLRDNVNLHLAQFGIDEALEDFGVDAPDRIRGHVNGFTLSTGVRGKIGDKLIGNAYLGYKDVSDIKARELDGDVFADLGLEYRFNDRWSATGNVVVMDALTAFTTGVRLTF